MRDGWMTHSPRCTLDDREVQKDAADVAALHWGQRWCGCRARCHWLHAATHIAVATSTLGRTPTGHRYCSVRSNADAIFGRVSTLNAMLYFRSASVEDDAWMCALMAFTAAGSFASTTA